MIEYDAGSGESAEIRRIVRKSVRLTQLVLAVVLGAFLYSKATLKNNYYTKCHSRLLSML